VLRVRVLRARVLRARVLRARVLRARVLRARARVRGGGEPLAFQALKAGIWHFKGFTENFPVF
jgi:hypothetical protein